MLGEFRRYTWHVFGGPCEDVPILTEEIDEIAFLFAVEVCTYDGVPLWVLRIQGYLLCLFGRLERTFGFRLLRSGDISGCLPAIATTRSRSRFSAAITRDLASRLLSATQADDFR